MEKSRKPKIRFKGFNDDWEQREFDEVFVEKRDKTERENEDTLLSCAINGIYLNSELFGHFRGATTIGYLKVNKNDLILSAQNLHLGNANVNLRFEHGIISPAYKVYDLVDCDPYFVHSWVKKDSTKNFFLCATTEGASQCRKNIEWHTLEKQTILMPVIQEQNLIGNYFQALDELITLHQRKLDKLINVKKSMLEKMFPKQGSTVPEVRFSGFTEDWEQRKLTEFVEFFSGLTYTPNDVQENGTLVLRSSNVSNGEVVDADNIYVNPQVVNSENVKVGDIVVVVRNGSRSLIGKHAQIKAFMPNTVIGAFMTGIRSECPEFTNALLNTSRFEEEIAMNMGATINQITGYMFSKMEFKVPCLDEQKKIGEYFEKLDNLITLHQRKLEKLKNIKKSMVEKMFI